MSDTSPEHRATVEAAAAPRRETVAPMVDLALLVRLIRRRWWIVALIVALAVGLAGAYVVIAPKTWRASARVLLDPRDKQLVGSDVNKPQFSIEAGWVETRTELVKSWGNLVAVVRKEKLADDPEFAGAGEGDATARAVRGLAEALLVERPKENNLVDVSVTTRSPEKSARLAQAVAEAFVTGLAQAKVDQIDQANALLSRQVETMRQKMQAAEAKVEDYKRENGIAVTRGNLVDEETMRQLNESLVSARQKTQDAKERWERLKQAVKAGDGQFPAALDGVGSAVLSRLKIEAALAAKRRTEIEQEFGPLHPKARAAAAEVERDRSLMLDQIKTLAATAEMDYQIARANEDDVRKNLDKARARLADTGQATVALQELENEAQARRELYKSFVSRMEETNLQKNTQISDATIVSPAQVPVKPNAPRRTLILGLALFAGLGAGLTAALLAGRRDLPALIAAARPDDAPRPPSAEPAAVAAPAAPVAPVVDPADSPPVAAVAAAPVTHAAPPPPVAESDAAEEPLAARPEPVRVEVALLPERVARLAGPGAATCLAETAEGEPDFPGLALLRRVVDELGRSDRADTRVLFADGVPSAIVAALAYGLARAEAEAGNRMLLVDLAEDPAPLDAVFTAASPVTRSRRRRAESGFERRVDEHGVGLARSLTAGAPSERAARLADLVAEALADHDGILLHLGTSPAAGTLFDAAEIADHVTLITDEKGIAGRRTADGIEVMRGLLPHFDGVLVLRLAADEVARPDDRRRSRRA